ncbi:hypothetical protein L596_006837 [Steinernema carpocapsae]|uniref:Peptidase S72 domain-containing protein n=1 Tax=Steinernema carpocapsae TaxID=34508 RepID=A0A4U5P852_STECR|nr:hypothetical protein L596_006837 [Steinernema carpocapsae]
MGSRLPSFVALLIAFALLPPSDARVYVAQVGTETGDNPVWSQSLGDWDIVKASLSITDCPGMYPPPSTITFCYRSVFDNDYEGLKEEKESLSTTTSSSTTSSNTTWTTEASSNTTWTTEASSNTTWSSEPSWNAIKIQCENKIVFNLEANLTGTVELKFNHSEVLAKPRVIEGLNFADKKKAVLNFKLNFLASMYEAHQVHQIPIVFRRSINSGKESNATNPAVFDFVFFKSSELNDGCVVELSMANVDPLGHGDGDWWIEKEVNSSVRLDDMGIAQQVDELLAQVGSRLKFDMKIDIRDFTDTVLHYGFWVVTGLAIAIVVILLVAGLFACLFWYWPRTRTVFVQGPEKIIYIKAPAEELVVTAEKEEESKEKPKEKVEKKKKSKREPRSDDAFESLEVPKEKKEFEKKDEGEKPKKRRKAKEKENEKGSPFVAKKKEKKTEDCSTAEKDKSEERPKGAAPAAQETGDVGSAKEPPSGSRLTKTNDTTHEPSTIGGDISVVSKPAGSFVEPEMDAGSKTRAVFSRMNGADGFPLLTNQDAESKTGTGNSKTTDFSTDIDFSECKTTATHFKD